MEQKRKDNAETQSARRIAERKKQDYEQGVLALDRKSPPIANGATGGAPSSTFPIAR